MTASPRPPGVTLLYGDLQFQQRYHLFQVGVVLNLSAGVSGSDPRFLEWRRPDLLAIRRARDREGRCLQPDLFPHQRSYPRLLAFMLSALGASSTKNLQSKSAMA